MQKPRVFIVVLTTIMLANFFFIGFATAAQVTKINKRKGQIQINEGKDAGFIFGVEVCFFSSTGEVVTCGKVQKTLASYAVVRVNSREAKKIKKGMEAILNDGKYTLEEIKEKIINKNRER